MDQPPTKKKRGNPNWAKDSSGKGKSGNPGGSSKQQKQEIFTCRMSALAEQPANLAKLIAIRDTGNNEDAMKAIRLMSEWAMPKMAPVNTEGEVVRDTVINVVVPTFGEET